MVGLFSRYNGLILFPFCAVLAQLFTPGSDFDISVITQHRLNTYSALSGLGTQVEEYSLGL